MKPTAKYTGAAALGLRGAKKGKPLDSAFVMAVQGSPYAPLEPLDERRDNQRVFTINALPYPSPRKGTHALGNRADTHLSGLFPLGADYPGCFVGGYPKPAEGSTEDVDGLLVKWSPGRLVVYVFPGIGHDKTVLVNEWKEGNLDGVELPK